MRLPYNYYLILFSDVSTRNMEVVVYCQQCWAIGLRLMKGVDRECGWVGKGEKWTRDGRGRWGSMDELVFLQSALSVLG